MLRPDPDSVLSKVPKVDSWTQLRTHRNALNAIRLALATLVLVSHSWPLANNSPSPSFGGMSLGTWAVGGFFALSGFLIAGSRSRLPFYAYLWRRCLRIFPALWVALTVTAFVIAPIVALKQGEWSARGAVGYVFGNFPIAYDGPKGFDGGPITPYGPGWNGSLWTLAYEFGAYLVLGAAMTIPLVRRYPAIAFGAGLLFLTALGPAIQTLLGSALPEFATLLGRYFLAGAFLWAILDRVSWPKVAAALCAVTLVGVVAIDQASLLAPLPLAMLLLFLGSTTRIRLGSTNDISYGLYVYAYPVQQAIASFGLRSPWLMMLTATPIAVALAVLSWFVVEKPTLRLKKWFSPTSGLPREVDHRPPQTDGLPAVTSAR